MGLGVACVCVCAAEWLYKSNSIRDCRVKTVIYAKQVMHPDDDDEDDDDEDDGDTKSRFFLIARDEGQKGGG